MAALDELIERSAAPAEVAMSIARLREGDADVAGRISDDPAFREAVVAVAGASRFLTRFLLADPGAADVLADLDTPQPAGTASTPVGLARCNRLELLRIAARDLTGRDPLEEVGAALAALADEVLGAACRLAGDRTAGLAVIGMGKLGGRELNYASDVDVMFVGDGDARRALDVARLCFRVDVDLRPEGRNGPLTRTLDSYQAYWDRWAEPWEFQALLKARAVAGPPELGKAFLHEVHQRLWTRPFGHDELRSVRAMKARAEGEIARRGLSEREIKRGPGGIRDVEFAVQVLQLVHGRNDPALRSPNTLDALAELAAAGYIGRPDHDALAAAYRFLRTVEHRLQLAEGQQAHAVPADAAARTRLARVLGYRDGVSATAVAQFDDDLRRHQAATRSIHERLFFRPLLEAFSSAPAPTALAPEAAEQRLVAFGFAGAERTRQALRELTSGLTRSSRLMQQMLPLLLGWLSESPDPDLGLLGLRTLATGPHRSARLIDTFRESPETARRLCLLAGTSRRLQQTLERQPDLIADLGDDAELAPRPRSRLVAATEAAAGWRGGPSERRAALLRLKDGEELRLAAADILGLADVVEVAGGLTALAEATLESSLRSLAPPVPMAIVALGRLGGAELSYASDLDVVLVYEGTSPADFAAAEATAEDLLRFVRGSTPATRLYALDADLRPEGKDGPLARSLDGYGTYYERWAQTWERQALLRARPVAGDTNLGSRFMALIEGFVWGPLSADEVREIRRMKARVERERIPPGEDPEFHLKLGRGSLSDVEWAVQLLQLEHSVRAPGTMAALESLAGAGALAPDDAAVLADAYRFCERTRNRLFLVRGGGADALPSQPDMLARLARSLDTTAVALRDEYRRVTRRARQVVERVFYGRAA